MTTPKSDTVALPSWPLAVLSKLPPRVELLSMRSREDSEMK
jgi:hypothetical protein